MHQENIAQLLHKAYKILNEDMQEKYPLVDLDEAIECISKALTITDSQHNNFKGADHAN